MTAGPPDVQRPDDEVEYLRRTPLRRGLLRRRSKKEERYIDTGAPSFRGPGEDHVVYVRRERLYRPWWRRPLLVIPLVIILLVAAAGTYVLTQRNVTTEVAFEDVVSRFEAREPVPVTEPNADVTTAPSDDPYGLPAEGVYIYQTSGGEEVSTFGAKHAYPSRTYATVRHLGGCRWEQRNDVIEEHVDVRRVCSRPGEVVHISQSRQVEFFGQRNGGDYVCEPWVSLHVADEDKGANAKTTCRTKDGDETDLTRTFLGIEPFVIEGTILQAVRVRVDASFTGSSEGTEQDDLWLSSDTGLPLRLDRNVDAISDAFGTQVHYTEDASFVLVSLDPQR